MSEPVQKIHEKILRPEDTGVRLDIYLAEAGIELSRSQAQKLIDEGLVIVNGKPRKSNYKLRPGDIVKLWIPVAEPPKAMPEDIPLDVLYEDEDVIVVNKPAGMVVHPAAGNYSGTLVNALLHRCGKLSSIGGDFRPGVVHRLDKDTSGVIVAAKSDAAHAALAAAFKAHANAREYRAIITGRLKEHEGTVAVAIGRHVTDRKKMSAITFRGKNAATHFKVLEFLSGATYVSLRLATGRTHQIRVHMAHIGHPLAGDRFYGGPAAGKVGGIKVARQMLHARLLGFRHPGTGEYMEFIAEPPEDMQEVLRALKKKIN